MKITSKLTNKCYFIRNDLKNALSVCLNINDAKINNFCEYFYRIYSESVIDQNATIIMNNVKEQRKLLNDYIRYNDISYVLSIDKFINFPYHINVSRIFNKNGAHFIKSNEILIDRSVCFSFGQTDHIQKLLIVDDDIHTGGTITKVVEFITENELFKNADLYTVGLANLCCEHYQVLDCVDLRDFVYNAMYSGIVTQIGVEFKRVNYLDDSVDLTELASIHPNKVDYFRSSVLALQQELHK